MPQFFQQIPTVVAIAGSDSSGGAGIQADLRAIAAHRGHAATAITAITAQNTRGVKRVDVVAPDMLRAQLDAIFDDLRVAAVKTGMLCDAPTVGIVAEVLADRRPPIVVCDPVLAAGGGVALLDPAGVEVLLRELLPRTTLLTPNADEAARLTGAPVRSVEEAERAGLRLRAAGAAAVLVKGGHLAAQRGTDVLVHDAGTRVYRNEWLEGADTHGTGCVLASALATLLARGETLEDAVMQATRFVHAAIRARVRVGGGSAVASPLSGPEDG